jgi:hypothetical protein
VIAAFSGTHKPAKSSFWARIDEKTVTVGLVVATLLLVGATLLLVVATWLSALDSRENSSKQIGVQTWLSVQSRFDSAEFKRVRKNLAQQLLAKRDEVQEELFEFFEAVANLYNHNLINKDLVISSFGFYAVRYWEACKHLIEVDRHNLPEGQDLYSEFEAFAKSMREETRVSEEKAQNELDGFLKSERDHL